MSRATIKIGVIGLGFGQFVHVPAFRRDSRCEIVALCSRSPGKAAQLAKQLGIAHAFESWEELLDLDGLDAVAIAVPPSQQAPIIVEGMRRGLSIFCEKPLSSSLKQAREVMTERKQHPDLPIIMDFEFPFIAAFEAAKKSLEDEALGAVKSVNVQWSCSTYAIRNKVDSWKTQPGEGGVLALFVSHCLLYLEWLLGPLCDVGARLDGDPGEETDVRVHGRFESGAGLSLSVCGHATPGLGHRVEIFGEEGSLVLENSSPSFMPGFSLRVGDRETGEFRELLAAPAPVDGLDGRVILVERVIRHFLDCIEGKCREGWPSLSASFRVQLLMDAIIRSHQSAAVETVGQ